MQAGIGLEKLGLPPVAAGLAVLVTALIVLDTFNQNVLGEGTLNNPVNSLGFAAAGKGPFFSHLFRIVSAFHLCLGTSYSSTCILYFHTRALLSGDLH